MNKETEITQMRESLINSKFYQGMALTPARQRMLDRDLTMIRPIGGYRGQSPKYISSSDTQQDKLTVRSVLYQPSNMPAVKTNAVDIGRSGCYLLPEALDEQGNIHVQSEDGMNIGIAILRAKSPILDGPRHTTRSVKLHQKCTVNGIPLIYSANGAEELIITGENTFFDILPGRIKLQGENITAITEMLSKKSRRINGRPDLSLFIVGEAISEDEENEVKLSTRSIGFGETVQKNIYLGSSKFQASRNPKNSYELNFVFD